MSYSRIILLPLILLAGATAMLPARMVHAAELAVVLVANLNVRSGPGQRHGVAFQLDKQAQVRVLAHAKGWLKIEHKGRQGFVQDNQRLVRLKVSAEPAVKAKPVQAAKESAHSALKSSGHDAENIAEQLKASQGELETISRQEQAVLDDVNAAEQDLDKARRQVRQARAALEVLQAKVTMIEAQSAQLQGRIDIGQAYAAQRLTAMYKLSMMGRIHLLATAESFFDFISRKSALERILSQDEAVLETLRLDRAAIESLLEQLNAGKAEQRASEIALSRRVALLGAEQARRATLLAKIRDEKDLKRSALRALMQAARELDSAIETLEPPATVNPPAAPAAHQPATRNFVDYKGLLNWPVQGKIVSFYGSYRDEKAAVVNFQSGINIKAERGEPIRAVSAGQAIFANWFKGFGNMLIIDHGDHYYTVYAHLEESFKVKGDRVEKDEVIATVGDSGSLTGPALHFEVRYHGKPVDPLEWINKG